MKHQAKLKNRPARRLPRPLFGGLVFEIWNFSGAWELVLRVSLSSGPKTERRPRAHLPNNTSGPTCEAMACKNRVFVSTRVEAAKLLPSSVAPATELLDTASGAPASGRA